MKKRQIITFSIATGLFALIELVAQEVRVWSFTMGRPYNGKSMPEEIYKTMHLLGTYNQICEVGWRVLFFLFLFYVGWLIIHEQIAFRYAVLGTFLALVLSMSIHFAFQPHLQVVLLDYAVRLGFSVFWLLMIEGSQILWKKIQSN